MKKLIIVIVMILVCITTNYAKPNKQGKKTKKTTEHIKKTQFGIDISHYNEKVDLHKLLKKYDIYFVIIKGTEGCTMKDKRFNENLAMARKCKVVIGIYHYFIPNGDPVKQAYNYIKVAKLEPGDIIPIVDIEDLPKGGSLAIYNWLNRIQKFLNIIERHYRCRPMIYTKLWMYASHLGKRFDRYPSWIAAYSKHRKKDPVVKEAEIFQFSETHKLSGKIFDANYGNVDSVRIKPIPQKEEVKKEKKNSKKSPKKLQKKTRNNKKTTKKKGG